MTLKPCINIMYGKSTWIKTCLERCKFIVNALISNCYQSASLRYEKPDRLVVRVSDTKVPVTQLYVTNHHPLIIILKGRFRPSNISNNRVHWGTYHKHFLHKDMIASLNVFFLSLWLIWNMRVDVIKIRQNIHTLTGRGREALPVYSALSGRTSSTFF